MRTGQRLYAIEAVLILAAVLVLAQFLDAFQLQVLGLAVIFALAGIGLNVLVGYGGLVSLGHVVFLGIGAYGWAKLSTETPVLFAFLVPIFLSMIVAAVIVGMTLRVAGYYFAITTLALGLLTMVVISNVESLTGGYAGMVGIPQTGVPGFVGTEQVVITAAVIFAIFHFFSATLRDSPLGAWVSNAFRHQATTICCGFIRISAQYVDQI